MGNKIVSTGAAAAGDGSARPPIMGADPSAVNGQTSASVIIGNRLENSVGGGIAAWNGPAIISGNMISTASSSIAGILVQREPSNPGTIANALLIGNTITGYTTGILFNGTSNCRASNNNILGASTPIAFSGTNTGLKLADLPGYNPVGAITNPYDNTGNLIGVLGTSNTLTSAKVYTCSGTALDIFYAGGTVTAMTKNGVTIPYNSTLTNIHLEPGDTFSITFSVTPTINSVMGW